MEHITKPADYLHIAARRGIKPGLDRIRNICSALGDPQDCMRTIHVAGTNGKGSFCAMLSSVLTAQGFRVGCFNSPAMLSPCDCLRIGSRECTSHDLDTILADIIPVCESLADKPTEFEVMTAAAFVYFLRNRCDIAIIECGMGGDTDATNIIGAPLLSVITNVQLDHTAFLGSTFEEIAHHKAGIIKQGCPALYGGSNAVDTVCAVASQRRSALYLTDHSRFRLTKQTIDGISFTVDDQTELNVSLAGKYQLENAANVVTAVEVLREKGLIISDHALRKGLSSVSWQGRFEVLSRDPLIIFDGAHNPEGIHQAADTLRVCLPGQYILLTGVMADKDYSAYPLMLGNQASCAVTVAPDNPRALPADKLAQVFEANGIRSFPADTVPDGVMLAYALSRHLQLPLVALGSLYMYADFRRQLANLTSR